MAPRRDLNKATSSRDRCETAEEELATEISEGVRLDSRGTGEVRERDRLDSRGTGEVREGGSGGSGDSLFLAGELSSDSLG